MVITAVTGRHPDAPSRTVCTGDAARRRRRGDVAAGGAGIAWRRHATGGSDEQNALAVAGPTTHVPASAFLRSVTPCRHRRARGRSTESPLRARRTRRCSSRRTGSEGGTHTLIRPDYTDHGNSDLKR